MKGLIFAGRPARTRRATLSAANGAIKHHQ
jgi:hypothetical protein